MPGIVSDIGLPYGGSEGPRFGQKKAILEEDCLRGYGLGFVVTLSYEQVACQCS